MARGCTTEIVRVFQDLRALFRWAVARGDMDRNPMEGMRMPMAPKPRERVLSDAELATLWSALPTLQKSSSCQRIIKLCLLTAQRVGEVSLECVPSELDIEGADLDHPGLAQQEQARAHGAAFRCGHVA